VDGVNGFYLDLRSVDRDSALEFLLDQDMQVAFAASQLHRFMVAMGSEIPIGRLAKVAREHM
jgi:hypothetical protein